MFFAVIELARRIPELRRLNRGSDGDGDGISLRSASVRYLDCRKPLKNLAGVRGTNLAAEDKHD
jgi:hypothetical protein